MYAKRKVLFQEKSGSGFPNTHVEGSQRRKAVSESLCSGGSVLPLLLLPKGPLRCHIRGHAGVPISVTVSHQRTLFDTLFHSEEWLGNCIMLEWVVYVCL